MASLLSFRPTRAVELLDPHSEACPLSLRDVLGAGRARLPLVRAPAAGVARAALVAAKLGRSALGLSLPPGTDPRAWFRAVAAAADEIAPRLPLFLSGEVAVPGASESDVERAFQEVWTLVDGGLTHVAVDLHAVPAAGRAEALARVADPAREREIAVELLLPLRRGLPVPALAAELLEELEARALAPDLAGARFPLPRDEEDERAQARLLAELCGGIAGTPVLRRGPLTPGLLGALADVPLRGCEDGGAAQAAAARALEPGAGAEPAPALARRGRPLPPEIGDRPEALAYVEVAALVEGLGAAGSAGEVAEAILARAAEE